MFASCVHRFMNRLSGHHAKIRYAAHRFDAVQFSAPLSSIRIDVSSCLLLVQFPQCGFQNRPPSTNDTAQGCAAILPMSIIAYPCSAAFGDANRSNQLRFPC
uniref:Uncharacterized protein n=1 Tax=Tetraselmis sp. GSL018 TaxID=582737 RepID=A0A061RX11_9CHLO